MSPEPQAYKPFSLTRGGLIYTIMRHLRLVTADSPRVVRRCLLLVGLTWLPMLVLTFVEGTALPGRVARPFLLDLTTYARFLVAMPLFLWAGVVVDRWLNLAMNGLDDLGMESDQERSRFLAARRRLERWRDHFAPEIVLLLVAFGTAHAGAPEQLEQGISSWSMTGTPDGVIPTLAGRWLVNFGAPTCWFLIMRWLWRMALWAVFLRDVAAIDLHLVPTHPDRAAGLGFLGEMHRSFGTVMAALAVILSARGFEMVRTAGWGLDKVRWTLGVFVVLAIVFVFAPLLVFMRKLLHTKQRGLIEYGALASGYVRSFDGKWLRGGAPADEQLLGSGDVQSLADIGAGFEVVQTMRPWPIQTGDLLFVGLCVVLSMLPAAATVIPVETMLRQIFQLLGPG